MAPLLSNFQNKMFKQEYLHQSRAFGGKQGVKRSVKLQGTQIFWFGALLFSQNCTNFKKPPKKWRFFHVFGSILDVFEDFSVLTEKQRTKPKNSSSLKFSASSDTQFDPKGMRLVERNDSGGKYPCVQCNAGSLLPARLSPCRF